MSDMGQFQPIWRRLRCYFLSIDQMYHEVADCNEKDLWKVLLKKENTVFS